MAYKLQFPLTSKILLQCFMAVCSALLLGINITIRLESLYEMLYCLLCFGSHLPRSISCLIDAYNFISTIKVFFSIFLNYCFSYFYCFIVYIFRRGVSKGSINNDKDSRMSNEQAITFLDDLVR